MIHLCLFIQDYWRSIQLAGYKYNNNNNRTAVYMVQIVYPCNKKDQIEIQVCSAFLLIRSGQRYPLLGANETILPPDLC